MPYKDKQVQKQVQATWYQKNKKFSDDRLKARRAENKLWLQELLNSKGCKNCGITDFRVLDFHHRDPKEKEKCVTTFLIGYLNKEKAIAEMGKCDILCANCHRIEHYELKLLV